MNDNNIYATGWYSYSPAFAWWNFNTDRMAKLKARKEAERITKEAERKENLKHSKIEDGTISVYA